MPAIETGTIIAQRYRLEGLLGQGGMGQVWAATHLVTARRCALKFLKSVRDIRPEARQRFVREARAASRVRHPNVIEISDVFDFDDETPVMVMELLEGESLSALLAREETLDLATVAAIVLPVVSAVGTAHAAAVIHRDLKPDNIFLLRDRAGAARVKVLDFGVAKLVDAVEGDPLATVDGHVVGTPAYMSPEQCLAEGPIDHRSDIWSLGVILYEALTGARPFEGANMAQILYSILSEGIVPISELVPDLPEDVATLVMRMLARKPAARPADLREVAATLAEHAPFEVPAFEGPGERPLPDEPMLSSASFPPRGVLPVADVLQSAAAHVVPRRRAGRGAALSVGGVVVAAVLLGLLLFQRTTVEPVSATAAVEATVSAEAPVEAASSASVRSVDPPAPPAVAVPSAEPSARARRRAAPRAASLPLESTPVPAAEVASVAVPPPPPEIASAAEPPPPLPPQLPSATLPALIGKAPF